MHLRSVRVLPGLGGVAGALEIGHVVATDRRQRLVQRQAAVARAPEGGVWAAAPAGEHGRAAPGRLLLLVALAVILLGELGLRADVDPPAREPRGEPCVLPLAADRQRELVVWHDDRRLLAVVVDEHLAHARGA